MSLCGCAASQCVAGPYDVTGFCIAGRTDLDRLAGLLSLMGHLWDKFMTIITDFCPCQYLKHNIQQLGY